MTRAEKLGKLQSLAVLLNGIKNDPVYYDLLNPEPPARSNGKTQYQERDEVEWQFTLLMMAIEDAIRKLV